MNTMLKNSWSIAKVTWTRWITSGKTVFCLVVLFFFSCVTYVSLNDIVAFLGEKASPWIFVWFLSSMMLPLVYAGICILIYSDAMLIDRFVELELIRTRRGAFLLGQLLFILMSSLVVVLIPFISSFLIVAPSICWDTEWGIVFHTIAESSDLIRERIGIEQYFTIFPQYLETMKPIVSMLLSLLLLWLYTIFTACMIGGFRILTGRSSGVAIAGFLVIISYLSRDLGLLAFGDILHFLAPLYWASPIYLNWYGMENLPTLTYVLVMFIGSIILLAVMSMIRFMKGDIHDQSTNG